MDRTYTRDVNDFPNCSPFGNPVLCHWHIVRPKNGSLLCLMETVFGRSYIVGSGGTGLVLWQRLSDNVCVCRGLFYALELSAW